MMRNFWAIVSLTGYALLGATAAQAADAATATTAKPDDATVMVCVTEPPPTGSHLGAHKECRTRAEWDAMHVETRDAIDAANRRSLQSNIPGG